MKFSRGVGFFVAALPLLHCGKSPPTGAPPGQPIPTSFSSGTAPTTAEAKASLRPSAIEARATIAPSETQCPVAPAGNISLSQKGSCARDADCTRGMNGRCLVVNLGKGSVQSACTYDECVTDRDCANRKGTICLCSASENGRHACLPGNCKSDTECGGKRCERLGPSSEYRYSTSGSFCHSSRDECQSTADCKGRACLYSDSLKRFVCGEPYVTLPG